ncbi:NAD(P)H-dependent oxidoreductase [Phytohabitans suffuscus]|uniref:FMN reductase n=1 Tax=Phytohabitans suffuscus TaxID=624315 RepID=A0A6F8Z002_9ACTN|nr:NAD(P)H-dependent oxidoreductase [Phytohabitans suffuscus]BCB91659.1 FMN reductase [Phytohabitans suffuscus]
MADLVVLVGNPRPASRTRTLAEAAADALAARLGPPLPPSPSSLSSPSSPPSLPSPLDGRAVLDLADLVGVTFGPEPARGSGAVEDPFAVVREARLLVVATPTYKGTYTGLLKIFLDRFAAGALSGTVAVPVAVAASEPHLRAVTAALHDLLTELGARLPVPALAVLEPALAANGGAGDVAAAWADRQVAAVAASLGVAA